MHTSTRKRLLLSIAATAFLVGVAQARPPATPITIRMGLDSHPAPGGSATLSIEVASVHDAPGVRLQLLASPGVSAAATEWVLDLQAGLPRTVTSTVRIDGPGNVALSARARHLAADGSVWSDLRSVPLHVDRPRRRVRAGWRLEQVPIAVQVRAGGASVVSVDPSPYSARTQAKNATSPACPPGVAPAPLSPRRVPTDGTGRTARRPADPDAIRVVGRWRYGDRSNVARDVDQLLIEIRRGNGQPLDPRAFCYTSADGTFDCVAEHPGSTVRVRLWSWTSLETGSGSDRLGVFSGPEVLGGCGNWELDCAYPVETAAFDCVAGQTCEVGTWVADASIGEPVVGALQMTQDMLRAWKRLWNDERHPAGTSAGPGRIDYPVPSNRGTWSWVGEGHDDAWINVTPPHQQVADIIVHEYGHVVMSNLWHLFAPPWPTDDCPPLHYVSKVSAPGCALSEGFSDFWLWYGNQFYDGDDDPDNDGSVFDFPGGAQTDMETRGGGTYQLGDQVEGNVAAALGDLYDLDDDGPDQGPADRVSDGIQHIWHTIFVQSDANFAEWWQAYWSDLDHEPCDALEVLRHNGIAYAESGFSCTPTCNPDECADDNVCTDDSCDSETDRCVNEPNSGGCDDGDACTVGDTCAEAECLPGPVRDCDDGNPCTLDSCDPPSGDCVHEVDPEHPCRAARDFDGDGASDLLLRNRHTGAWLLHTLNGRTVSGTGLVNMKRRPEWTVVGTSDHSGDGRADVLLRDSGTGAWFLYMLQGRAIVDQGPVSLVRHPDWVPVSTADHDGDGRADVLLRNAALGRWRLYELDGRRVRAARYLSLKAEGEWQVVGTSDHNGDGRADVLLRHADSGRWFLYLLDGFAVVGGGPVAMKTQAEWQPVSTSDHDGDGRADVLLRHADTGQWLLYSLDGKTITDGGPVPLVEDPEWDVVSTSDHDGDRRADVMLRRGRSGPWWLYRLNGRTVQGPEAVALREGSRFRALGGDDYNGDGQADALLRNCVTGVWWLHTLDGSSVIDGGPTNLKSGLEWIPVGALDSCD